MVICVLRVSLISVSPFPRVSLHVNLRDILDINDSGSLSSLTFNGGLEEYGCWKDGDAVTIDTIMSEADFSGKKLGAAGAQILAAFMSTKLFEAKGSLVSLNLANNNLKAEGAKHVAEVLPKW